MAETARRPEPLDDRPPAATEMSDLSPDSVIRLDLDGTVIYWNPASERLYGLPAIGAKGRNIRDMSVGAVTDVEQWPTLLREGAWEGVVRRITPWGDHVAVAVRQTVRWDADGQPVDVVEYGRAAPGEPVEQPPDRDPEIGRLAAAGWELDISAVRPLLEAISHRSVGEDVVVEPNEIESVLGGIVIADINDRAVELVGAFAGRSGMIGQPLINFWPAVTRHLLVGMITTIATAGEDGPTRLRKAVPDGILRNPVVTVWRSGAAERREIIYIAVNGAADDDRSFSYLRASEARYRKLMHHLPSALLQVDAGIMGKVFGELAANGMTDLDAYLDDHPELIDFANNAVRVIEANREAVALFGGNAPADFIRPVGFLFEATPVMARRVMVARFKGQRNLVEIMKIRTFDGRLRDVRLSVTYPAPPERLDITLLYLEDITERLHTERQLRQLEVDFTHSARISMIGELATSIAHEVNQPLSAIVTNGETSLRWLSRSEPNIEKVVDLTTRIVANARRASDVVQHIRGMAANHAPARLRVNLNAVIEEALLFLRHDLESRSITLATRLCAEPPDVIGDRVQLQQVVVNLIVNSIQAIAQANAVMRRIEIETRIDKGTVVFWIHDSGPGIDPENIDRIFESFFTTKPSGVGIGLAICQSIMLAHGGNLVAANHSEGGAVFSFSLLVANP